MNSTIKTEPLQNDLSAFTKAWLANVVIRHKDIGNVFVSLSCERPVSATEFDKRVIKLVDRFRFQTAQSLSEIEILLLELLQLNVVTEERMLRLEKQLLNFNNFSIRNGGIPDVCN